MCSGALLGLVILSVVLLLAHSSASSTAAGPPFTVSAVQCVQCTPTRLQKCLAPDSVECFSHAQMVNSTELN